MSYDILTDTDKQSFIKKVNERINTGWIPFGGISITYNPNTSCSGSIVYAQAFLTKLDFDHIKEYQKDIKMENNFEIGSYENPCCRKHWEEKNNKKAVGKDGILWNPIGMPFITCKKCGNKRCPKATDCSLDCTNSNEPGQKGSIYG